MNMGIFTRRMNVEKAKKASLQERGPKNNYGRAVLRALHRAKIRLETIYGVKVQKMPYVIVAARKIHADRETFAAYLEELKACGQMSEIHCKASREYQSRGFDAFSENVWEASQFATHALRARYDSSLQMMQIPPAAIMGPYAPTYLDDNLAHELVHHVLWEQRSPVYAPHKHSMYAAPPIASQAANEGLAMYVQDWQGIPVLKSAGELGAAIIKCPINLIGGVIRSLSLAIKNPICFMAIAAGAFMSAATRLRKFVAAALRNTIWWEPKEFARALEKYPIAYYAFDPYSDGLAFVKEVVRLFSSQKRAFDTITKYPPESMREVLIPDEYLRRVRKDVNADIRKLQ